jgi:hypothetical protein
VVGFCHLVEEFRDSTRQIRLIVRKDKSAYLLANKSASFDPDRTWRMQPLESQLHS